MSPLIENLDLLARSAVEVESHNAFHERFVDGVGAGLSSFFQHPHAAIMEPIFQSFQDRTELVGFIFVLIGWDRFFANLLPPNVKGIYGVLENTCGQLHTYIIQGNKVGASLFPVNCMTILFFFPPFWKAASKNIVVLSFFANEIN